MKIIQYITASLSVLAMVGCKKYVENGNVNINPNRPSFVTLNTLLPAVEDATASSHYQVAYTTTLFSEQMASYQSGPVNDDQNRDVRMGTAYSVLYQSSMTNCKIMMDLARQQGSPHYMAIARILLVANLALATDTYGDVPFTQAFQAPTILYPVYDKQETLYPLMQLYLDSAITESRQANPTTLRPATDDLIFAGDTAAWRQTAYFLKARLYMHTTKKGAQAAATSALAALANAYTATSKDFQLVYNDKNINPWNRGIAARIATGNFFIAPAKRFVDALNGTAYPGLVDPRIGVLIDKKTNANYVGIPNGIGTNISGNSDLTNLTFYAKPASPLVMASYAEQKLLEAEARFIANGGTATSTGSTQAAYDAYMAGITANMTKVGAVGAPYLANTQVAVGAAGLKLELIMREKQVVLFLNPEAWTDIRRYNYDATIFRGMVLPQNQDALLAGQFIRRSGFPYDEINRNPNASAAAKPLNEKVWWDQ